MIEIIDKHKARLRVSVGGRKNRKRYTKTVEYKGKRDLQKQYDEFVAEVSERPRTEVTVEQLLDAYIRSAELAGCKATTIRGYEIVKKRIICHFKDDLAHEVTAYQLEDFIAEIANLGRTPKTIRNTISLLDSAYKRAIRLGRLKDNPCERVLKPKRATKEKIIFTEEEMNQFVSALDEERLDFKVCYCLALFCGLRRSEILGIRESDVALPFKQLVIRETRHRISGSDDIVQEPKTASSRRTLALPDFLVKDIDVLIKEHHASEYNNTDYLIQNGFGEPMPPQTVSNHIKKIEAEHGLPLVSVHGLRHTYASLLNHENVDIARISRELGHSTINTTLGIYTHVFNNVTDSSRGIADTINKKFERRGTTVTQTQEKTLEMR